MCNIVIVIFFYKSNWFLRMECVVKTLYVVGKCTGDVFLILLGVALVRGRLACTAVQHVHANMYSCGVKDSKAVYTINGTRIDLLWFLKDIFDPSSGSSIFIASCDLQYSWWEANDFSELKVLRHLKHTCQTWTCFDVFGKKSQFTYTFDPTVMLCCIIWN